MKRVVLQTLVSLLVAFALAEVAVRALYKDETVMFPRYHTDYRYGPYTLRGIRPNAEFWHTSRDGSFSGLVPAGEGFSTDLAEVTVLAAG